MKTVADTLAVARSNLIERVSRRAKSRRPYRKAGDDELLALIRRLVDERPTYGYRRIRRGRAHPVYPPYTEHVPPDVTAAIFWLNNRDPQHWRDSQQLEQLR